MDNNFNRIADSYRIVIASGGEMCYVDFPIEDSLIGLEFIATNGTIEE